MNLTVQVSRRRPDLHVGTWSMVNYHVRSLTILLFLSLRFIFGQVLRCDYLVMVVHLFLISSKCFLIGWGSFLFPPLGLGVEELNFALHVLQALTLSLLLDPTRAGAVGSGSLSPSEKTTYVFLRAYQSCISHGYLGFCFVHQRHWLVLFCRKGCVLD